MIRPALLSLLFAPAALADAHVPGDRAPPIAVSGQCPKGARAPVVASFPHGEGTDPSGPFLHRSRALTIIEEELSRAGVPTVRDVARIESIHHRWVRGSYHPRAARDKSGALPLQASDERESPLLVDGVHAKSGVAFVYLAVHDWRSLSEIFPSDPGEIDLAKLARAVAARAASDPSIRHLAVFYDPLHAQAQDQNAAASLQASENLLRVQVQDYLACLRATGTLNPPMGKN